MRSPQLDVLAGPLGPIIAHRRVILALRLAALALFVIAIVAGLAGDQNPYRNIAPTLVWIIWWVGLALVAAFAGDIWALVNPWRTLFDGAQWLSQRFGRERALGLGLAYPEALGTWPACLLLLRTFLARSNRRAFCNGLLHRAGTIPGRRSGDLWTT